MEKGDGVRARVLCVYEKRARKMYTYLLVYNNIYKCTCRQFTRMCPLLTPYQHYMYNITYYDTGTLCSA